MKVKIRGLVFAGFAAAVFAQSASAEITDSDKTVTSKTYVDSYAQAQADRVLTKPDADSELWDSTAKYPSMKVLGDKVEEVSTALSNLRADEEYITLETVGTGTDAHQEITVKSNNLATTAASITDTTPASTGAPAAQDKLVTASAVNAYAEAKANKLATDSNGETITAAATAQSNNTSDTTYPTTKNVYDFVTGGDDPDGGFHPKLTSNQASVLAGWGNGGQSDEGTAIAVGYRAYDSTNPNAVKPSEWKTFGARANGSGTNDDYHLSYLTVQPGSAQERDKYFIDIKANALAKDVTAISAGGTATGATASQTADKLTTAKAVYDYAVKQDWGASNAGKKLVINNSGYVDLTDAASGELPPESTMPEVCKTPNGNHVCALVAYYDATAQGVVYEWTVMAPTGN